MTLFVRPLAATDPTQPIVALWDACGLTRPWNDVLADLMMARDGPQSAVLLGHEADALAATVMVGFDGHRGWVYYLAVALQARGCGHGRTMMAAAEAWLRARGCPAIRLMVREDNAAIGFYRALGYTRQEVVTWGRRLDSD